MRYTRSKEAEKAYLDSGKFLASWEVKERKLQKELAQKKKRKERKAKKAIRGKK